MKFAYQSLLTTLVLFLGGCIVIGPPTYDSGTVCTPGVTRSCACSSGVNGTQACRFDGAGYTICICQPDSGQPDVRDAVVPPTDARDVAPPPDITILPDGGTSPLYGRCTTNTQCGTGGRCLTTFPGGVCSRTCTNDSACGSGSCVMGLGMCLPSCVPGALDCDRYGGACIPADNTGTVNVCLWSCFPAGSVNKPAGYPDCPSTMACDPYSGACGQMSTGAADGAACTADADCAGGRCITEIDTMGQPTGWIGGYCLSFGRQAPITQGQPVPPANCPPGAGTVPLSGEQEGDGAPCLKTCNTNTDCRPGYQCDHLTPTSGTGNYFSNGICLPTNCRDTTMPPCPTGYTCMTIPTDAGPAQGQCVR